MMHNKKIIAGIVAAVVIIVGIALTIMLMNNNKTAEQQDPSVQTAANEPFRIDNFYAYPAIDADTRDAITSSIQEYVKDVPRDVAPVGKIRDGSFEQTNDGTVANTHFLVDIDVLKRSYKISFGNDSSTDESSLYILCPAQNELIYPPFNCKDDLSESE